MRGRNHNRSAGLPGLFHGRGTKCLGPRSARTGRAPSSATRVVVAIACALLVCGATLRHATAQSSILHRAFADVDARSGDKQAAAEDPTNPSISTVQLVSGQQPAATRSSKPPQSPKLRRAAAPKLRAPATSESSSSQTPEELPTLPMKAMVPLAGAVPGNGLSLTQEKTGNITLIVRDKPLSQVLALLAQTQQLNIVASNDIDAVISITLKDVPLEEALTSILAVANYTWVRRNNIILITSLADSANLPADVQGRQIQVFDLDFVSAANVEKTITNFLSPIGKVSVCQSSHSNNRQTQERIIVEDLPESLARIAAYIAQVDHPPRQVLIEAHVLQVNLKDDTNCGIDLSALGLRNVLDSTGGIAATVPTLATNGLASATASPGFVATLGNSDLGAVINALTTQLNAKTLGSPKLLVVNEQEARIQVGQSIPFQTSTTTQTSTTQNVQFLETGVILRIIPRITRDGRVLLHVHPEVSDISGQPTGDLPPPTSTAQLDTDVMLDDGEGMIIGGLIKENDTTSQSKIPYLGDVKYIGVLFRHTQITKERDEIIVALVPRVQPYDPAWQAYEQGELVKTGVPLFHGPLCRTDRPWDPILPDGKRVATPLVPDLRAAPNHGYFHDLGPRYDIPPYPLPEQHFYGDAAQCGPGEPQLVDPMANGPSFPEQELPMPPAGDGSTAGSNVISNEPTTPNQTPGGK